MKRIDFIGTSAAGKTTLLKQMLLERNDAMEWVTPQEARIEIAKQQKYTLIKDGLCHFIFYNLYFLCKRNPHFLGASLEKLLIDKYTKNFENNADDYNCLFELLLDAWDVQKKYIKAFDKMRFNRFYESILIRDVALLNNFEYDHVFLCDDGILHNNTGLCNSYAYDKLLDISPEERKRIIPSGVVYCKVPLETNILWRKKRIANGNMTMHEQNISEDKLIQLSKRELENVARKAKLFRDLKVPLLEIDMTKSYKENIPRIISFIERATHKISTESEYGSFKEKKGYNPANSLRCFTILHLIEGLKVMYAFCVQDCPI